MNESAVPAPPTERAISFADATRLYVHRFTMDHVPNWARQLNHGNRKYYAPQYASDREWYERTAFPGEPGCLNVRGGANATSTRQTWPLGQWLDEPYTQEPLAQLTQRLRRSKEGRR